MLISFSVANFLSFCERVDFNMLALESDDSLASNVSIVPTKRTRAAKDAHILKSAAIYGPNASGKSNLISALTEMFYLIGNSVTQGTLKSIMPFLLEPAKRKEPSEFEVSLLLDGKVYRYGFIVSNEMVLEEWLLISEKGPEKLIFERLWEDAADDYIYTFGPAGTKQFKALTGRVRPDALMISVGAQFNASDAIAVSSFSVRLIAQHEHTWVTINQKGVPPLTELELDALTKLLRFADIGLETLELEPFDYNEWLKEFVKDQLSSSSHAALEEYMGNNYLDFKYLYKDSENKPISIPRKKQSTGTKYLLNFFLTVLQNYKSGCLFLCDELETSLHPMLCAAFLRLFHGLPNNKSQLIFTIHDATLLNADVLRRDQVYIVEKDASGQSNMLSLADYKGVRKGARLGKQYLDGLFGGLPMLDERIMRGIFNSLEENNQGE